MSVGSIQPLPRKRQSRDILISFITKLTFCSEEWNFGSVMSARECKFQRTVELPELKDALRNGVCDHCGATVSELIPLGQVLEICGQEYCFDYETGEAVEIAVALCPACHEANHLDAQLRHNPCHISARRSREKLE